MNLWDYLKPSGSELRLTDNVVLLEQPVHYVKSDLAQFNSMGGISRQTMSTKSAETSLDRKEWSEAVSRVEVLVRDLGSEEAPIPSKVRLKYIKYDDSKSLLKGGLVEKAVTRSSSDIGGLVIPPVTGDHHFTIIFLHGLGDRPHTWAPFLTGLNLDGAKLILPKARKRSIKAALFLRLNAWFNIYGVGEDARVDVKGLLKSTRHIESIVESEIRYGIPPERIFLAGFSQGGALALTLAQRSKHRYAGIIALSSWLPMPEESPEPSPEHMELPVIFLHGDKDPLVSHHRAINSAHQMDKAGMDVQVHIFEGLTHDIHDTELATMKWFIEKYAKWTGDLEADEVQDCEGNGRNRE